MPSILGCTEIPLIISDANSRCRPSIPRGCLRAPRLRRATQRLMLLAYAIMSADARQSVTIALAQTPVSPDVSRNLRHITAMMARAKAAGADLVQFTEGALSGYGRKALTPFERWRAEDWTRLRQASDEIAGWPASSGSGS